MEFSPKRRLHVIIVTLDDKKSLVDIGVGGASLLHPIEIKHDQPCKQGKETYRLIKDALYGWFLKE
ncbi:arylamine N-acetyltransferase [Priestia filamentosa]|uniref:arylamine N-acetyltransferase n=1 Tax=Priestia filamentosa TaxID=1402861 RepID=UPI003979A09D